MSKKAVILFSGGLDSTTCLAIAQAEGYECYALGFAYGQKHQVEIERSLEIAKAYNVAEHKILTLPLDQIRGSTLTDNNLSVPDYTGEKAIPNTYVPARNTIFLSFALAWAEVVGAFDIFYGANYVDYSGYPDCRPDYMAAFEKMAGLATKIGDEENSQSFKIHAPLLYWDKARIIQEGMRLGVDYGQTISCYRADSRGAACGRCDSCTYRKKGFQEANIEDPTVYQ